MSVILETTLGDIVIDLFTDERPRACLNFLKLCKIKYYNYCLFHSVEQNFMAQTGDPSGSGRGGESVFSFLYGEQAKYFEMETKPQLKHKALGTISMVNGGTNMLGSQFFITLAENLDYLDGVHTVFGEVVEGHDILEKINEVICDDQHRPYQDIRISHTVIVDDPFDDPPGLSIPDRSPEPTKEQLESGRIGADEEIDDTKDKTAEEVEEMISERELKAGTQILEMIGDIPDADVKPPENVLFVCKLNPVTKDEDLEIIFSRFGQIKSCEVIRDQKSGESLQYAFIEFEKEEDCEKAYFKMDNVLIDDRRIHVDFSQSVAKVQSQTQGARPVIDKKEDKAPKYAVKDKSGRSKYDLVFDDSGNEEDRGKEHRKDGKKKKRETSDFSDDDRERRKKKKRNESDRDEERKRRRGREDSDSEEEYKRNRERRREREKRHKKSREYSSEEEEDVQRKHKSREYKEERHKEGKSTRRERESSHEGRERHDREDGDYRHTPSSHKKDRHHTSRKEDRDRKQRKETGSSRRSWRSEDKSSNEHRSHRHRDDY